MNFFKNRKIIKETILINKKHPEITDKKILDLMAKDRIQSKSRRNSILMFAISTLLAIIVPYLTEPYGNSSPVAIFEKLILAVLAMTSIIGILKFFGTKPLLDDEDIDHLEQYKKENNIKGSFDKVFETPIILRLLRINPFLLLVILILLAVGTITTISGANTMLTYEESMRNAVEVQSVVVDYELNKDDDRTYYSIYYEYTYNDVTFDTYSTSSYPPQIGSSKTILIDSQKPHKIIDGDGKESLISGIIVLSVSLLLLIITLIKTHKDGSVFSLFDFFAMIFYFAAIGFGIWGILSLIGGNLWGTLILLGCTIFFFAGYAFCQFDDI